MKLINVDDIEWAKGVFVTSNTEEPLPIVHKIATIEMLRDWQEEVKAIPIDKIKKAREEIRKLDDINPDYPMDRTIHVSRNEVLKILDKLIESEEKE